MIIPYLNRFISMLAGTAQFGTMGGAWEATSEELGGLERLTAGQKAMLLAQKTALLVILCCEDELVESGYLMGDDGKTNSLLRILESYLSVFPQGQVALGIGRPRMMRNDGPTMRQIMKEYENGAAKPFTVRTIVSEVR